MFLAGHAFGQPGFEIFFKADQRQAKGDRLEGFSPPASRVLPNRSSNGRRTAGTNELPVRNTLSMSPCGMPSVSSNVYTLLPINLLALAPPAKDESSMPGIGVVLSSRCTFILQLLSLDRSRSEEYQTAARVVILICFSVMTTEREPF